MPENEIRPKVSVVIPSYKMEKYLSKCLDSVVNQTLKDIEIIVVDEGDMDESRAITDLYKEKDPRIVGLHAKHGGYGASMNAAFDIAKGEYIGIVEADDFADVNMFEDLYKIADKTGADIVKSDYNFYAHKTSQSRKVGMISKARNNKVLNIKQDSTILRMRPTIWTAIYKNEFLKENNIKFLTTKGGSYQDTSFAFKTLALAQKIAFTTKSYLYYNTDNENSSVKSKGKVYAICDEFAELTNFINEHSEIKQYANTEKLIKQYNAYIWNIIRIDENYREEFVSRFANEFKEFYKNGEITEDFYKNVNKKDFNFLINDKKRFMEKMKKKIKRHELHEKRNKKFSIRINTTRISIVLFGKQVLHLEY